MGYSGADKLDGLFHAHDERIARVITSLVLAVMAFSDSRALAQDLWFRIFLHRVDVVRMDLSHLPLETQVTSNGSQQVVQTADLFRATGLSSSEARTKP